MSFRNRCMVAGAEGIVNLTIPLVGGRDQKVVMRDLKIDNRQNWQLMHWRTICSCYNRSPWFEHYRDEVKSLYDSQVEFLLDWNFRCFEWVNGILGLKLELKKTVVYEKSSDPETADWRNRLLPKNRKSFPDPVRYYQVFEERTGFIPNLSVLDLIFCEGKMASQKIRN